MIDIDTIRRLVNIDCTGRLVYDSVIDLYYPGATELVLPIIEDNLDGEVIDWAGVEKDLRRAGL